MINRFFTDLDSSIINYPFRRATYPTGPSVSAGWRICSQTRDAMLLSMALPYYVIDVFGDRLFGNPVAVVLGADDVPAERMAAFAAWTNLSETTFVSAPTDAAKADYRVRIFTQSGELPFAGHPTLGTCSAWLSGLGRSVEPGMVYRQECGAGIVPIRAEGNELAFAAPPARMSPVGEDLIQHVATTLDIDRAAILDAVQGDNGPAWLVVRMAGAAEVLRVTPKALDRQVGLVGPHGSGTVDHAGGPVAGHRGDYEVRAFVPHDGAVAEDPVTGSLNAIIAQWFHDLGREPRAYTASQGRVRGRRGLVRLDRDDDGTIWVGGAVSTSVAGTVML